MLEHLGDPARMLIIQCNFYGWTVEDLPEHSVEKVQEWFFVIQDISHECELVVAVVHGTNSFLGLSHPVEF